MARGDRPTTLALAWKDIDQLLERVQDLEICELCEAPVPHESFNVCGACYNKTVNGLLDEVDKLKAREIEVASAIVTERERCAKVADRFLGARDIVAAIRNQSGETQPKSNLLFCDTCHVAAMHKWIDDKWECTGPAHLVIQNKNSG